MNKNGKYNIRENCNSPKKSIRKKSKPNSNKCEKKVRITIDKTKVWLLKLIAFNKLAFKIKILEESNVTD